MYFVNTNRQEAHRSGGFDQIVRGRPESSLALWSKNYLVYGIMRGHVVALSLYDTSCQMRVVCRERIGVS